MLLLVFLGEGFKINSLIVFVDIFTAGTGFLDQLFISLGQKFASTFTKTL